MEELIIKLHSIGVIKWGSFEIKKDYLAPFQVDFRVVISHPGLAKQTCALFWKEAEKFSFDLFCGVPLMGALFANFLAWEKEAPLVLRKSEAKSGDLHAKIEGSYKSGQRALVLQDQFLTGNPTLDLIEDLESEGITVHDALAFIDLELGGKKKIKTRGYVPHYVITMSEVLQILMDAGRLPGDMFKLISDFLAQEKDYEKKS